MKIITVTPEGELSELTKDEILRTNLLLESEPLGEFGALVGGAIVYAVPAINTESVTAELGNIWAGKARVIIHGLHNERVIGP